MARRVVIAPRELVPAVDVQPAGLCSNGRATTRLPSLYHFGRISAWI